MKLYSAKLVRSLNRWVKYFLLSLLSGVIVLPVHATATQRSQLPTEELVPGGIAIVSIPAIKPSQGEPSAAPVVHFRNNRVLVVQAADSTQWRAVIGIPRSTLAGKHPIAIQWPSSQATQHFVVTDKHYAEQRIQIENKRQVNPMTVKLPTGKRLAGKNLTAFQTLQERVLTDIRWVSEQRQIVLETASLKTGEITPTLKGETEPNGK